MEVKPGFTNGVVTLLDPVERGWVLNSELERQREIGKQMLKGTVCCDWDGRPITEAEADMLMFSEGV